MSNLRPAVRTAIRNFVQSQNDSHIPIDVLRVIQEEANLMKETQEICDCLDADPFEELNEIKNHTSKLKSQIQVVECSRIRTGFDYCSIDAVVSINDNLQLTFKYERKIDKEDSDDENNAAGSRKGGFKNSHNNNNNNNNGQKIWYSIDISHNYGQRQKLLLIQVFAPNGIPSGEKAVCVTPSSPIQGYDDDDDDEGEGSGGWEDIDDDDNNDNNNNNNIQSTEISETTTTTTTMIRLDNAAESSSEVSHSRKKQKLSSNSSSSNSSSQQQNDDGDNETKEVPAEEDISHRSKQQKINNTDGANDDDDDEANNVGAMIQHITNCDTYSTSIDPEVLHDFLESAGLLPMGEATAFFLLMTFPFYEHEWDLVGFVLQEVFGASPSDDDESSADDDDDDTRNEQCK